MAEFDRKGFDARIATDTRAEIDEGLRSYMLQVYNYMASALFMTGGIAYLASLSPDLMYAIFATPLKWVVMLAPLGFVFFLSARIHKMSATGAQMTFWIYSMIMGLSLSSIFLAFTGESIARTFFITASVFGAMSLWGYTTKKDLSGMGSFLFMGLIGIVIASLVNIFLGSTMLQFVISCVGVLVFTGLTAYDTQEIKSMYFAGDSADTAGKKAIMGALRLYLDFINLFIMLLQLFGNRE